MMGVSLAVSWCTMGYSKVHWSEHIWVGGAANSSHSQSIRLVTEL